MTGLFVQGLPALESKWASPPLAFMLVLGSKHRSVWLHSKRFIESSLQPQLNYVDISKYFKVSGENICMWLLMKGVSSIQPFREKGTFPSISCGSYSHKVRWQWQPTLIEASHGNLSRHG